MRKKQLTCSILVSGLRLDFQQLKTATDFVGQIRLAEGKPFTNGMMYELQKSLDINNSMLFSLLENILPLTVLNDERFPKTRQSFVGTKLGPFNIKIKSVQKTKDKLKLFVAEEFVFFINSTESKQERVLKKKVDALETENKNLQSTNEEMLIEVESLQNLVVGEVVVLEKVLRLIAFRSQWTT